MATVTPETRVPVSLPKVGTGGVSRQSVFPRFGQRPSYALAERTVRYILRGLAYLTVGITAAILLTLLIDAAGFFQMPGVTLWSFFGGTEWKPFNREPVLGVLPLLNGTLMIAIGASVVAVPLGLGTAIFLTQYANRRVRAVFMPIIEVLGGIPTVVYGYFALQTVTPFLKATIFPEIEVYNALSASIVVGIAILPMISSLSMDALQAVPTSVKNAGYAIGMRRFHVTTKIVIPAALSGIIASFILGFSRAVGETMAVTLAAGSTPSMQVDYLSSVQTMTAYIVQVSLGDIPYGGLVFYTIYAIGLTLFLTTFLFNYVASLIVRRFREAY
ncbi:MAG: phosphate ABC transporter permease subunit PstC [Spirochaetales bacterium]|nr:phosphate ABC transporter permease subunit PstC [Leptospiraceae bacterium]MCP5483237.1 phosphate ABC transporter permease subunit PstC [Spirochaetales bacterium]MCP5486806.1 phosphate ABC transporter permease subunit PstC [Spirochaetales bacterium]